MLRLRTFGGLWLERTGGESAPSLTPRRLALLAVIAAAGRRGASRERVLGLLWPERPEELGRHALSQTLYNLRRELGVDVVTGSNELRLDPAHLSSDVGDFLSAAEEADRTRQAALYTGPFLDGFYLPETPEFERWAEEERAKHHHRALEALQSLAREEERTGHHREAAGWLQKLATLDPLNGDLAVRYMRALAAAGDRAGALAHGRSHQGRVQRDLEAPTEPAVLALLDELKRSTPRAAKSATTAEPTKEVSDAGPPVEPVSQAATPKPPPRRLLVPSLAALIVLIGAVLLWRGRSTSEGPHTLAVGIIRDQTAPDSLRAGSVLTDMLATSLGRIEALRVVANSRLLELMQPGSDTSRAAVADAARRAGAREILEGEVRFAPQGGLLLELRRVDLQSGVVRRGYRLSALDRYGLVDSSTAVLAADLGVAIPQRRVAELTTTSPVAYRFYEEGLRAYYQYDAAAAFRLMSAALEQDSLFPMAAYYAWLAATWTNEGIATRLSPIVRRLAARASDRERLMALTNMAVWENHPDAVFYADTLGIRYPEDPQALYLVGTTMSGIGDYPRAIQALERSIAVDSAAGAIHAAVCRICDALGTLIDVYFAADSVEAYLHTARRLVRLRPTDAPAWVALAWAAWRNGRKAEGDAALARYDSLGGRTGVHFQLQRGILQEDYQTAATLGRSLLTTAGPAEQDEARWHVLIALRNLGRYREAQELLFPRRSKTNVNDQGSAAVLMEAGAARQAAGIFLDAADVSMGNPTPGHQARGRTWAFALAATALAIAGDTAAVRRLVDSTEQWGRRSLFGRDPKLHFFLRGLLLAAQGRNAEAVDAYRHSVVSLTMGYTRINFELAGSLIAVGRAREAIAPLQSALRGGIDGSNLYMSRTELHERLAEAFEAAGMRDSAAAHYRKVAQAWSGADPELRARVDRARQKGR